MANRFLSKNSKGLSAIVTTLILVALVMGATALIWGVVNTMIKGKMSSSESCFDSYSKVELDKAYTCYEEYLDGSVKYTARFALYVKNIDSENLDKVIVGVTSQAEAKSYGLTNTEQTFEELAPYGGAVNSPLKLPVKNSQKTYNATGFTAKPDAIKIILVINGNQCDVSDSLTEVENCAVII